MRKTLIAFVSLCLWMSIAPAEAHINEMPIYEPEAHIYAVSPHRPTKQHSTKNNRVSKPERKRLIERRKFNRKTHSHGAASTSTFQKALPSWYTSHLLQYRGMVLSEPALRAYYEACQKVGHYIGGAGYRSHAVQASMSSSLAAPPGYSYHEVGLAADIFGVSEEEHRALIAAGFQQLNGEPWHYSYRVYG